MNAMTSNATSKIVLMNDRSRFRNLTLFDIIPFQQVRPPAGVQRVRRSRLRHRAGPARLFGGEGGRRTAAHPGPPRLRLQQPQQVPRHRTHPDRAQSGVFGLPAADLPARAGAGKRGLRGEQAQRQRLGPDGHL